MRNVQLHFPIGKRKGTYHRLLTTHWRATRGEPTREWLFESADKKSIVLVTEAKNTDWMAVTSNRHTDTNHGWDAITFDEGAGSKESVRSLLKRRFGIALMFKSKRR